MPRDYFIGPHNLANKDFQLDKIFTDGFPQEIAILKSRDYYYELRFYNGDIYIWCPYNRTEAFNSVDGPSWRNTPTTRESGLMVKGVRHGEWITREKKTDFWTTEKTLYHYGMRMTKDMPIKFFPDLEEYIETLDDFEDIDPLEEEEEESDSDQN